MASRYGTLRAVSAASPHRRLGVERDTQAGGGQHVEVVGAVAHRHRPGQRHARELGEPDECGRLSGAPDHRPVQPPRQPTVCDLQHVRRHVVDAQLGGQPLDDLDEPAAHHGRDVAEPLERPHQGPSARSQHELVADLVELRRWEACQEGEPPCSASAKSAPPGHRRRASTPPPRPRARYVPPAGR